ncbi:MAG: family 20 glycosylhydrolase [Brevundimonas sp.]|uniref:family 20 glycosylhydrolase n=1 Tax=Brevundimonas sp. TaxID=1871086 RepID=UPI00391DD565
MSLPVRSAALLVALVLCLPVSAVAQHSISPPVIPAPLSATAGAGAFRLDPTTVLVAPPADPEAVAAANYLADLLGRSRGLSLSVADEARAGFPAIVFRRGEADPDGYTLEIAPDGVTVTAADAGGFLYGAVTLWQLATAGDGQGPADLAALRIVDAPRFGWRGLMLDSARHYQSPEFIKGFIDWMALHKLNVFHWHLTDDQGWRLEIKAFPRLTEVGAYRVPAGAAAAQDIDPATGRPRLHGGFYTQDEVREIVAWAAARNIVIVPEIDVPGHASAAIAAYPELGVSDAPEATVPAVPADWGVYHTLFNTEESTIAFFEQVLAEVVDLFPGTYVHLGGDEAVKDQWKASPRTQARMRELGVADEAALQSWFIGRMEQYLNQRGRRLIGWDEILEGGLAPNATVMSWRGVEGAVEAARLGHDTVLSPAPILYLDNRQSAADGSPGRGFVVPIEDIYRFDPTPEALTTDQARHVLGVQANIWTEHMRDEDRVEYMAFPRVAALAELAWSAPARMDWDDFTARLTPQLARYRSLGIDYAELALSPEAAPLPPQGERRYDHQMTLCSEAIALSLIDDAPLHGDRPSFLLDLFNPCWIYRAADLTEAVAFEAAVGQVPFNFQIGADIKNVRLRAPRTPAGELEVRVGGCEAEPALVIPLAEAARNDGVTIVRGRLPAAPGVHDLCMTFTQAGVDPIWALDWVRLTAAEGRP